MDFLILLFFNACSVTRSTFLAGISSLALAVMTSFLSFFVLFLLAYPFGEVIGYISYDIVVIVACFLICRRNPGSIWYVPIICNIVGIIAAFGEENFYWISSLWIIICGGWVLSLIVSIIGARIGKRKAISANSVTNQHM
ncbi:MAG: hypothetical protein JXB00_13425 [Bacteroidales bacterium]|nr:hypothetical protein [Bacteroidales bacterium]